LAIAVDSPSRSDNDYYRLVADQWGIVTAEDPNDQYANIMMGEKGKDGNWTIAVSECGFALVSNQGTISQAKRINGRNPSN
jgi:hypothetical protein